MKTLFPVAVLGLGALTPTGDFTLHSPAKTRQSDGFSLPDFALEDYLATPKTYLDRASALALAGCALALQDAGLNGPFDENFGITLGTQFGCIETMRGFEEKLAQGGAKSVSPLLFSHSYFNSPISLCAIEWVLKGAHGTFCGENAGRDAVVAARDAIGLGHAQTMLCGGVEALSPARTLAGEANPGEASVFWVLGRADGKNPLFDDVWVSKGEVAGNFGAVGALLAKL